jgi:hypothetical protein
MIVMVSCGGGYEAPPVIQQSEHLILRGPPDLEVCGGTFSKMESEVMLIRALFGEAPGPVDYAWLPVEHYVLDDFPCAPFTDNACAYGSSVYARTLASTHELVHASRKFGLPTVLEEGLATVLSDPQYQNTDVLVPREEPLDALTTSSWANASSVHGLYERSAHFVSFLFAAEGMDKFIEFERRVQATGDDSDVHDASFAQWAMHFEEVYGQTFDDAWEAYQEYPDCPPAQYHHPVAACAALEDWNTEISIVPAFGGESASDASFARRIECDQAGVFGPMVYYGDDATRASMFVLDVDVWLPFTIFASLAGETGKGSRAILTNCGDCWDGSASMVSQSSPKDLPNLQSGRHALVLYQAIDEPGEVGIELSF